MKNIRNRILVLGLSLGLALVAHADFDPDPGASFCDDAKINATDIMQNLQNGISAKDYVRTFENKYTHSNSTEYYGDTMYLYNLKTISKAWSDYIPSDNEVEKLERIRSFSEEIYQDCIGK